VSSSRRAYLDWLRGVAVLCMIEWHVLASWTTAGDRTGDTWAVIQLIGGFAAPLFLFLAGLAVPFAIESGIARGRSAAEAAWAVQKRGWQVFLIAHLFRLQSFITNPGALFSSIFKPDILNILGLGLAGAAWLTGKLRRADGSIRRNGFLAGAAVILILTPWARVWWWPTLLHPRFEAYIRKVGNYGVFELFPWIALVLAGAYVGSLMVAQKDPARDSLLHHQFAAAGITLAAIGFLFAYTIPLPHKVAWAIEPWPLFLIQVGSMTAAIRIAWGLFRYRWVERTSGPLVLFGRTSLFVYWVHIELSFGFLSYPLHGALPLGWAAVGFVLMTVAMYFAARWWDSRPATPWIPAEIRAKS